MRATEAEARCEVLQRQADTLRAQSSAVQASSRDRVESLTVGIPTWQQTRMLLGYGNQTHLKLLQKWIPAVTFSDMLLQMAVKMIVDREHRQTLQVESQTGVIHEALVAAHRQPDSSKFGKSYAAQEQTASLAGVMQGSLAQEKNERAKIVTSLRETIHGLRRAGDVEGRLKTELIQQQELLAAAKAAQACTHLPAPHGHEPNTVL